MPGVHEELFYGTLRKIYIKRFLSKTFTFADSIAAYEYAAAGHPDAVKLMIEL
jgi:hypothetical protein